MNMAFYSVSCSLYDQWLEYSWADSFIQALGLKIRLCSSTKASPLPTRGSQFSLLRFVRLEAVMLMWRAHHLRQPEGLEKYPSENTELLGMRRTGASRPDIFKSHKAETGCFCICTQRESWLSRSATGRTSERRICLHEERMRKRSLAFPPLQESAFLLHKGKGILQLLNQSVTCCQPDNL